MQPADRDLDIISRILDDSETVQKRIAHFGTTEDSFCNDRSFEGELAYNAIMIPVYRIAEDAIHLSSEMQDSLPNVPWKDIRGFRNFIAHGYSEIDRAIAWKVVVGDIPALAQALQKIHEDARPDIF